MAASDRAAKLVTCNLQPQVNLKTGEQDARCEYEDRFTVLSAATEASKEEEEEEGKAYNSRSALAPADIDTSFSGANEAHVNHEDFLDFSGIYKSNKEYFRKLEELKAAHLHTMAKLEKMYQNKLNLKPTHPVFIREDNSGDSSGSISEKNDEPVSVMPSFSEPDLGIGFSFVTSSSEDELSNLEKEYPKKNKLMNFAKELINSMWTNFSVEDYTQGYDIDFPVVRKIKKKPKEWTPKITVPEPFQMTLREAKKKEGSIKPKSDTEMQQQLHKNQNDDSECKKQFRANPVPSFVFIPLYDKLVKEDEERRRSRKEKNKEALLASQKPFKFIAREEQKKAVREKQWRDSVKPKKKTNIFKAAPVPLSTYEPTNDKLKEEWYKNMKTQLKIQELLQNPSPRSRNPTGRNFNKWKPKYPKQTRKLKSECKVKGQTAEFEDLPEQYQKYLPEQESSKYVLGWKPFALHTVSRASSKREKLSDINTDEEKIKEAEETYRPNLSPVQKSPVRCTSSSCNLPVPTVSSRVREQATRRSLEEKKMLEEERNRILTKQKQRMKELQKLLIHRAKAYDTHQSLAQMCKARVKSLRKSEKERMREYRQELEEREEKLKHRPLLFERVAQKNARMAAEKHYSNTLKALGISDEFVSKKGQNGKIFEYFSNEEMKIFTEDKESSNEEEKIEEGENGEENYFIDSSSHESCKEKDEADEEYGEEESVE